MGAPFQGEKCATCATCNTDSSKLGVGRGPCWPSKREKCQRLWLGGFHQGAGAVFFSGKVGPSINRTCFKNSNSSGIIIPWPGTPEDGLLNQDFWGCAHLCYTPSGESTARPLGFKPSNSSNHMFSGPFCPRASSKPSHRRGVKPAWLRRHRQPGLQSPRDPTQKNTWKAWKCLKRERYCIYIYLMENPQRFQSANQLLPFSRMRGTKLLSFGIDASASWPLVTWGEKQNLQSNLQWKDCKSLCWEMRT